MLQIHVMRRNVGQQDVIISDGN